MKKILILTILVAGCAESTVSNRDELFEEMKMGWPSWPKLNYERANRFSELLQEKQQPYFYYLPRRSPTIEDYENLLVLQDRLARKRQQDLLLGLQQAPVQPRFDWQQWQREQQEQLDRWQMQSALERIETELFFQRNR